MTIIRRLADTTKELDIAVHTLATYPEMNNPIKMEVSQNSLIPYNHKEMNWYTVLWLPITGGDNSGLIYHLHSQPEYQKLYT